MTPREDHQDGDVRDPVRPWHRMDDDWFVDGAVRATGFAWAWPFITAAVKRGAGKVARLDVCDRALFELAQVPGCPAGRTWTVLDAFSDPDVGLLAADGDGFVIPKWGKKQIGNPSTARWRKWNEKQPKKQGRANAKPTPQTLANVGDKREPTETNHDGTGRDVTKDAADAAATHAPAHTHEDAPPPPAPAPGPKTSTNSSTDLRPHPMPVKAPKLPPPGDTTIRDRADELVRGSPAADRLRPLAEVAIEVTGYDVGIHTLAQWLGGNYSVERVRAGCAFAVQKYVGQCVPEGTVINTATKWMLRARPDEYPQARAPLAIVPPPPAAPERVRTPEEQAEIMRQFDELSMRLSEPEPATKTASARGR